ncbi:hypothetical protein [Natronorubrum tibetense]|uniref:Uncharacterized protein n=2 Tax=Natronorubrum tibetense TaxID=63128 RepID=L9VL68_9EURY|nr:hypothetical protein [Natronorubrum tibetense]ELY37821.1 hypothetical protein C496_20005 [Natronorubrum tibetense GA33]
MATAALAGCLSTNNEDNTGEVTYEQCTNRVVSPDDLPELAKDEANTAIETGKYESESGLLLPDVIDVGNAFLSVNDDDDTVYYEMVVTEQENIKRLELEKSAPSANPVSMVMGMENPDYNERIEAYVYIENEGEALVDEPVTLDPDERVRLNGNREYRYGKYRAKITAEIDGSEVSDEIEWTVSNHIMQPELYISDAPELITIYSTEEYRHSEGFGSACRRSDTGELVAGQNRSGEIVDGPSES